MGRGGGPVVSLFAFFTHNVGSYPADVYCSNPIKLFEKNENKTKKRLGLAN